MEREIARVRGEIERMEGRLRVLGDLTALATVTISIREVKDYVPPLAPTYADRVTQNWQGSLSALTQTGQAISLGVVAAIPWLVALVVPAGLLRAVLRRRT